MVRLGRRCALAVCALVLAAAQPCPASAHGSAAHAVGAPIVSASARAHAEQLTLDLANLNVQYHGAAPGQRGGIESSMLQVAINRAQALAAMLEDDPAEFLRVSLPSSIRAALPASVQAYTEEETDIEGTLEVLHEDSSTGDRYLHRLQTPLGTLTLKFAADPLTLLTGSRIRARGTRLGQTLALTSGTTSTQTLAATLPNSFGAQSTLVILVNFQDKATQPYTVEYAKSVVFTTTSNWDLENSYGQTWLTGTVVGWYTIPVSSTNCDYYGIASHARQAAAAHGVNTSNYSRHIFAFPKNACGWWGLGSIGGSPSEAWINGNFQLAVVGHEMGHNFGLYHSHAWECGAAVLTGACTQSEYGDVFDIMGKGSNHFSAFQKERLGWLNSGSSPGIATVTAGGTYTIAPYEKPGGVKALKILQNATSNTYYYLEFRQPIGFDASIAGYPNVVDGILAHTASPAKADSSRLLDMTPATASWYDPGLLTGLTYYDSVAGVRITPAWTNSTNAGVTVAFGTVSCVKAAPTVSASPSETQWAAPGTAVTFTVTTVNHDSVGCASSTFNVSATVPAGWAVTYGATPVTIAPGASASSTVRVTSPLAAADGFYTIGLKTTDVASATRTASTSATYAIATATITTTLSVSVTTDRPSYAIGAVSTITTAVRTNGAAVAGASVLVTITRPGGSTASRTATTGSDGNAAVTYQIKPTDPAGTYKVASRASVNDGGVTAKSSTTFTVSAPLGN